MKRFILSIVMFMTLMFSITSVISCSDRIDDELTLIKNDISVIDSQLIVMDGLLAKYDTTILNNTNEIIVLKENLNDLKNDYLALESKVSQNDEDIVNLKKRVDNLEYAIFDLNKLLKNAVTSVVLQETLDCVVGTINLPGFNPGFLASYVGENKTGMPEFPIAGSDFNADPDGNVLLNTEIKGDPVWNSGKNSYLINGIGNAGKLYFTLNPLKVDANYMSFDLVNSLGEVSPIKLSNITPSEHLITFAIGKHGNGMTRADDNMTYLYEADATVDLDGIEQIHFDYTKFGYQNQWNIVDAIDIQSEPANKNANNVVGRFKYLAQEVSNGNSSNVLTTSLELLQDFYNGVYSQRNKLQKQALKVSWDNGNNAVVSGYDITTVTINPLNYKQMRLLDQLNPKIQLRDYHGIVDKIVTFVKNKMPNVTLVNITWDTTEGKLAVYDSTNTLIGYVELQGDNGIITNLSTLTNSVNDVLTQYNTIKTNMTGTGLMTRVNNFLNAGINKFRLTFDNQPAWRLTEPILLFDSGKYGIKLLQNNMSFNGEDIPFIMTSLTEEYIVPVYMKYIAVLHAGQVKQSYIVSGNQKIVKLTIPNDKCEIVYQTSDYYGNVVTKRYQIN